MDNSKFLGHIPAFSPENELAAWQYIAKVSRAALSKYRTTCDEDDDLLDKDERRNKLGIAKRNCILYRKGEKVILNYLIECAESAEIIVDMSSEDALRQVL